MNIKMQCCGMIILLILLFFFIRQKRVKVRTASVFFMSLWVTLVCVLFDIFSIITIQYSKFFPDVITSLVCKLYLVSLVWVGVMGILYVCSDIFKCKINYLKSAKIIISIALIISIMVLAAPIEYHFESNGVVYTEGLAVMITYFGAVGYVLATLILLYLYRSRINERRFEAARIWMIIWFMSAFVQFMWNSILVVGFASCIGLTIVYIKLENPDNNVDRKTGMLNQVALTTYLNQCYYDKCKKSVLFLRWSDSDSYNIKTEEMMNRRMDNLAMFNAMDADLFRYTEEDIVFVFQDERSAQDALDKIQKKVDELKTKYTNYICRYEVIYFKDIGFAKDTDKLLRTMRYIRKRYDDRMNNEIIYVNEKLLMTIENEKNIEKWIEAAIEDNSRVMVYYQPIYSIENKCFSSAEALVRITDDEGKIVMPGDFIGISEKNGSILKIGKIVFEKVCRFLRDNKDKYSTLKYIEVNLSVVQCAYEYLAEEYIEIMKKYKINPEWINLEITESTIIQDQTNLLSNMNRLKEYGVSFSLDDFGTGASNLNYIVDMHVDIVKFDRVMSKAYFENNKAKYVMEAAMMMIRGLKLKIVAEGIETESQLQIMKQLKIDYIQGYYFSKPLPEKEYLSFIESI